MFARFLRACGEELRRVVEVVVGMYEHMRELDEQALRSLGVIPREPRSH